MINSVSPSLKASQTRPNSSLKSSLPTRLNKPETGLDSYQTTRPNVAKFGDNQGSGWESAKNITKKTAALALGALSFGGLAIGVPLGLLQMAVGIFFHPLLITGALTIGIPLAALAGSIWLGTK
jgi:hypothetical protein